MPVNTNATCTSVKDLTALPGIGVKFALVIISVKEIKGVVKLDNLQETPLLQRILHELLEKKLITMDAPTPQNGQVEIDKFDKITTSLDRVHWGRWDMG